MGHGLTNHACDKTEKAQKHPTSVMASAGHQGKTIQVTQVGRAMFLRTQLCSIRTVRIAAIASAGFCALLLAGCAGDDQMAAQYVERPIEQIYADAWKQIDRENWLEAGKQFDEVERQHPYSVWARRAMLMSAYSYYEGNRYQDAIDAANRFIQLHPEIGRA